MKILILSPFAYYSGTTHGGGVLSYQQLRQLAQEHEVHFLAFSHPGDQEWLNDSITELLQYCASVKFTPLDLGFGNKLRAAIKHWIFYPNNSVLYANRMMHETLRKSCQELMPDVVLVQFPQMAQYIDSLEQYPTLLDVQDAFSVSTFRLLRRTSGLKAKIGALINWLGWVRYETNYYPRFNRVMALTDQDRVGLEIFSPGIGAAVCKAAVTLPPPHAGTAVNEDIAFAGSFGHPPNCEAVSHFIEHILPLILIQRPDIRFLIAGKNPPESLTRLATKNVIFVGYVPDIFDFFRSCAVTVVPLLAGGGIKIKTLEAMAAGCPVVSTSIGAEEIGAISGTHLLQADSNEQFALAVSRLLNQPEQAAIIGENARLHIEQHFSWQARRNTLNQLLVDAKASFSSKAATLAGD